MKNYKKMSYGPINFYLKPEYVYIPLEIMESNNITILVKKGENVYKGTLLARKRDENKINIVSPISGTIIDFVIQKNSKGKEVNTIKIKNDFKECYETKRIENKNININKEDFLAKLKQYSIVENNNIIYKLLSNHYKTIIINAKEDDPYITSKEALIQAHADEILETLDYILKLTRSEECIILINQTSIQGIDALNNYIGTYDRIKMEKNTNKEGIKLNIETIYTIYETIRYDIPQTTKIITLSGEGFKNPQNIMVKIGTKANEIIEAIGGYKRFNPQKMLLISGNALTGKAMRNDDFIIDFSSEGILTIKIEEKNQEKPCIKCGKCINICPQKLNPLMLTSIKNTDKLKKLNIDRCNTCALCSYICPSKRNICQKIIEVKESIK